MKARKKPSVQEVIELGLNLIAQDLVWKTHTEKDIQDYLNQFIFIKNGR
jgi:hypothetical protein